MTKPIAKLGLLITLAALLVAAGGGYVRGQTQASGPAGSAAPGDQTGGPSAGGPSSPPPLAPPAPQPGSGGGSALEIAPQPAAPAAPEQGMNQAPSDRHYAPSDNSASVDQNYDYNNQGAPEPAPRLPYLGISVEYATKCFAGQEERGLEIISIDANSPAAKAGLHARGDLTAVGAAGVTAGALLGPLEIAVVPLLKKSGQLGQDGDLIVAIDDKRVRSDQDLEDELAKLKPGDTMYVTVIRPLGNSNHKTMKIAVKVGTLAHAVANAGGAAATPDAY